MISDSKKSKVLRMFARTDSEVDPEAKATKFLEAIALTDEIVEEETNPNELVWIANIRRSNCRAVVKALGQVRTVSLAACFAYSKVVSSFSLELLEGIKTNKDIRRILERFFAMHCPIDITPRFTQVMLGEIPPICN